MKHWEVMKAYEEGAEIEVWNQQVSRWLPSNRPLWDWSSRKYRVKPEEPEKVEETNLCQLHKVKYH